MPRVDPKIWSDPALDHLDGDGIRLLFYLLTGPPAVPIPGLIPAGVATLAEGARMDPHDCRVALKRLIDLGLVDFDEPARLVRVPSAPASNPPVSPNQLRAWWYRWNELPPSRIKVDHVPDLAAAVARRKGFAKAWDETFGSIELPEEDAPAHAEAFGDALRDALRVNLTTTALRRVRNGNGNHPPKQPDLFSPSGDTGHTARAKKLQDDHPVEGFAKASGRQGEGKRYAPISIPISISIPKPFGLPADAREDQTSNSSKRSRSRSLRAPARARARNGRTTHGVTAEDFAAIAAVEEDAIGEDIDLAEAVEMADGREDE